MAADTVIRRVEARAARLAGGAALVALLARGGDADWATGIVGGWALVATSAWLIRTGVERTAATAAGPESATEATSGTVESSPQVTERSYLGLGLRVTVRYALLAAAAYVMIGRLRLSPVGLLIGASSIVVSASIEAIRTLVSSRQL